MADLRPLDRFRSLKVKLGVLVVASCSAVGLISWYGLLELGLRTRYTLPIAVLAALAVTQVLAHGMTAPLRELAAAARAMARGDYSRRVRATSRDEVGEAARAFNVMAEDLATVDRQRRELVANVSHELRTPISALQAVLENVVDGVTPAEPEVLAAALEQVERLGRLVSELLDLSRLDAGGAPALRREPVRLGELVHAAVREARMTDRDVEYAVHIDEGLTAWADTGRLHQVVANLLDNASRHSPPGGVVTVTGSRQTDGVRLSIADQGPGIAAADRERVFQRFTRGGAASAADVGTGLGLAIARWAVDLHGGRIRVGDPPTGCRIDVDLPAPAPAPAAPPSKDRP